MSEVKFSPIRLRVEEFHLYLATSRDFWNELRPLNNKLIEKTKGLRKIFYNKKFAGWGYSDNKHIADLLGCIVLLIQGVHDILQT